MAACYEQLAQQAISEGEYYLAHDAANYGLRCAAATDFPLHRLISLKVTALARSGATGRRGVSYSERRFSAYCHMWLNRMQAVSG